MQPSSREVMLSAIKEKYPTFSKASAAYSTSLQPMLLADTEKAYSEKSPTLSDLERMYGYGSSSLWVKTQLLTIDFASSTKEGADENALNEFSGLFVSQYHYIKLTEFILFVARFLGSFRLAAGRLHHHKHFNFTESREETVWPSLCHSCRSELTRQGISLP